EGQKSRAYFSEKTNVMLENIYASNPYPNKDLKAELAEKIKITEGQVSNWFSRRRKRAADEALEKKQHQEMLERLGGPKLSSLPQASSTPVSITTSALALSARSSPSPSVESPGTPITLINGALKRSRHESEQDPKQKLRSMEVSKKLSFLLRGGAIVNPNDVDEINDLMEQTGNDDGKKYILNALLSTKSPTVQERFLNSSGLGILRSWIIDARKSPRETHNADLLLKSMLVLKSLPFTVSKLFECKLGKSVKLLARDNEIGPDIKREAGELEAQWRQLVNDQSEPVGPDPSSSSANDKRTNRTTLDGRNDMVEASLQILPKFKKGARVAPLNVDSSVKVEAPLETPPKASPKITENAGFFKELIARPLSSSSSSPSLAKRPRATSPVRTETKSLLVQVQKNASNMTPPVSPTTIPVVASTQRSSPPLPSPPLTSLQPTTYTSVPVPVPVPAPHVPVRASSPPAVDSIPTYLTYPSHPSETSMEDIQPVPAYIPLTNGLKRSALRKPTDGAANKKVVRFRSDKELVAIRLIEPRNMQQSHDGNEGGYMEGDGEARPQFFYSQKEREELIQGNMWREPALILLEAACDVPWGRDSIEKQTQETREMSILSATYLQDAYIPPTPEEPDTEYYDPSIVPKQIPLFEPTHDHSEVLMNSLALLTQIVSKTGTQTPAPAYPGFTPQVYGQSFPMYNPMAYTPPPVSQPAPVTTPSAPSAETTRMLLELIQQQQSGQVQQVQQVQQQQQQQQQQQNPFALMYGYGQYPAPAQTQTQPQQPTQTQPNYNPYGYYYQQ
ncbi:hypothetical protein CPC16_004875, partial [Podila verticillata]